MRTDARLVGGFALGIALFASLGSWQVWRAGQRSAVFDGFAEASRRPALTVPIAEAQFDEFRYRWIELRGQYLPSRQFLLDSMTHDGRAGYHVLTPFSLEGSEPLVLVNRGWVPADPERRTLPDVNVGESTRTIRAQIDALPRPGLTLDNRGDRASGWPQVLLFPTFPDLEARQGTPIRHYQLLLSPEAADGFVRVWQPRAMPPERHIGYAIQWYSFAVVLGVIGAALWWRARRN